MLRQLLSTLGLMASIAAFAIGGAIAIMGILLRPELGPGLKDVRIMRQPATPLIETVEDSEPLRRLLLARARHATQPTHTKLPEAYTQTVAYTAAPGAAEPPKPDWFSTDAPQESASRLGLAALARERAERRLARLPNFRLDLGKNALYQTAIGEAAMMTGLSPAALAALIDAEARKTRSGRWDPKSKSPTSSARGLAQFLAKTWLTEARNPDRFVYQEALSRGLIDSKGRPKDLDKLLEMRMEPRVAIIAAAEMAADNLVALAKSGYAPEDDDAAAKLAYLAHHEGLKGAQAHLAGVVNKRRAEKRLKANITGERAEKLLAAHDGKPHRAYAAWLEDYIAKRIQPERFHNSVN